MDSREVARWVLVRAWSIGADRGGQLGLGYFFRGPGGVSSGKHERNALTIGGASGRLEALARVRWP